MVQHSPDRVVSPSRRAWVRDAGIVRLRRLTALAIAASAALSGIFAGLAASAAPGRKIVPTQSRADPPSTPLRVAQAPKQNKPKPRPQSAPAQTPAPPPAITTTTAPPPSPAPPPAAPVIVQQQAPVIVSGGS